MESTFRQLLRLRPRQDNCKRCLWPESKLLTRKLPWSRLNLLPCQPIQNQSNKKKMTVTSKLLRRSRPRWLLPKLLWIKVFKRLIIEFNK